MKRVSNLFSSDQSRRPASALLRAPNEEAVTSQQRHSTGQWLQGNIASYDSTLSSVSQPGVSGVLGRDAAASSQQQQEQAWIASGREPTSLPASRPSPPNRAHTADDRPAHAFTNTPTLGPNTVAFPHERADLAAHQMGLTLPNRPASVQSLISAAPLENGLHATSRPVTPNANQNIERADLHKLLKSIGALLINFDEYRSLQAQLSKVEKALGIGCADLAKNKTMQRNPSTALALAGNSFAAQHEVSGRYAKAVQKEYDTLNEACAKHFKTIAKEEKNLDDFAAITEDKIKKAQFGYERGTRKATTNARTLADAHEKYISTISALASATTAARDTHATAMAGKSHAVSLRVASTLGGIADSSFRAHCDSVRCTGVVVGPLAAALNFCVSEAMPLQPPIPLTEDERDPSSTLAAEEARNSEPIARELVVQGQNPSSSDKKDGFVAREQSSGAASLSARQGNGNPQDRSMRRPPSYRSMAGAPVETPDTAHLTSRSIPFQAHHAAPPDPAPNEQGSHLPLPSASRPARAGSRAPSPTLPARQTEIDRSVSGGHNWPDGSYPSSAKGSHTSSESQYTANQPQTPVTAQERYEPDDRVSPKPSHKAAEIPTLPRSTVAPNLDRRRSLWEQEREQQESREREAALERRAREAEDRLRFLERATSPPASNQKSKPSTLSSSPLPQGSQDYFALQTQEEERQIQGLRQGSRSPTVSRTLSNGTTASEMSFVARMKSRYQLEKESQRANALRTRNDEGSQQQDERRTSMSPTQSIRGPQAETVTRPRPGLLPRLSSPAPLRPVSSSYPRPDGRQLSSVRRTSYQTTSATTPRKPAPRRDEESPYGESTRKSQSNALEELLAQEEFNNDDAFEGGGRSRVSFRRGSPSIVQ
ncbi:hypothetical protein BCV69DRAFT_292023 [Microstroma glucosiphilum]|uniref:Uncharacterized protein n=1 Tax=Pseudomicrostroma glucosiphilum TaxID=1684307 RepID=A0A316UFY7_9BASI|nr:hypothetical protein BCV69DRAFT_292023 [Pseudomicrostroma glucosiphilum]PWN24166.1 hypothetical protein BCV69DRAFT_292023 [Pseudomicrostroma glucosiphilum]